MTACTGLRRAVGQWAGLHSERHTAAHTSHEGNAAGLIPLPWQTGRSRSRLAVKPTRRRHCNCGGGRDVSALPAVLVKPAILTGRNERLRWSCHWQIEQVHGCRRVLRLKRSLTYLRFSFPFPAIFNRSLVISIHKKNSPHISITARLALCLQLPANSVGVGPAIKPGGGGLSGCAATNLGEVSPPSVTSQSAESVYF